MKRIIFGGVLILSGVIGILVLLILSVVRPWDYNDITGLLGFLLGSNTFWAFAAFCIMAVAGLAISIYEAYIKK